MSPQDSIYGFGDFTLDTQQKVLFQNGKPVSITPKALHLLSVLVECHGRIVEKEILLNEVWPDSFVEESNLTFNIRQLRKTLGDRKADPEFIETVPRRGYRFVAEVCEGAADHETEVVKSMESTGSHGQRRYLLILAAAILVVGLLGLSYLVFWPDDAVPGALGGTRLTNSGRITTAAVSPDGKMLVFSQNEGGGESLWKREIATGKQTRILGPEAAEFVGLAVSPGSDYAYYSVFAKNSVASKFSRVPLVGGEPQSFPEIASDVSVTFSPDGARFAYTESHSAVRETLLKIASIDGTSLKTLVSLKGEQRTFPVFRANPVAWSPDGEEIACAVQEVADGVAYFRILLVNPENASERYLSEQRWDFIESLVWKDRETLAITNLQPSLPGRQIWLLPRNGGVPTLLRKDLNKYEWLSAAGGKLFAVEKSIYSSLLTADFDESQSKVHTKQFFNEPGDIENIDWPKEDKIYYNSWTSGKNEIWQIDTQGTQPRQLTNDSYLTLGFAISPTNGEIVFTATRERVDSLFTADPDGQNIRRLTFGIYDSFPRFMPDGNDVVYQKGSLIKPTIWRVSVKTNGEPSAVTGYFAQSPSVSPDGKMIAYQYMDFTGEEKVWRLAVMDSAEGSLLNKLDFPSLITERTVVWRPGDNTLTMAVNRGENSGFLFLSLKDNSYRIFEDVTHDKISSFAWSPDGRRLAFAVNHENSDAVVIAEP